MKTRTSKKELVNSKLIPTSAVRLLNILNEGGYEAYLVGGCVRDLILGVRPNDFDMCTNATPNQMKELFRKNGLAYLTIGMDFGTITAQVSRVFNNTVDKGIDSYEVTTYRKDSEYKDNRHPDKIEYTSFLEDDLSRRDFTINAMAYDPMCNKLVDPYNGLTDLNNGVIKAVGDADKRFKEDALRIMRALRFSLVYAFGIEQKTAQALHNNKERLSYVSTERITQEITKILTSGVKIHDLFLEFHDIIFQIIPELSECYKFNQRNKYHKHDVYEHTLCVVDNISETNNIVLKMAALLHDIGKPKAFELDDTGQGHFYGHPEISYEIAKNVLNKRFKFTAKESSIILELVRYHDMKMGTTKKSVKRVLNKFGDDFLSLWLVLRQADIDDHVEIYVKHSDYVLTSDIREMMNEIKADNECFTLADLEIDGNDIMTQLRIKPSQVVGIILNKLLNEVIEDNKKNNKKYLLCRAEQVLDSIKEKKENDRIKGKVQHGKSVHRQHRLSNNRPSNSIVKSTINKR